MVNWLLFSSELDCSLPDIVLDYKVLEVYDEEDYFDEVCCQWRSFVVVVLTAYLVVGVAWFVGEHY